jgi:DNA-binding NarL/FixJ family response regulator
MVRLKPQPLLFRIVLSKMKIVIASNNTLIKSGIQHIVSGLSMDVSELLCDSFAIFMNSLTEKRPTILFFDKSNTSIFTHTLLREIRTRYADLKIIVISDLNVVSEISESIDIGVHAYLTYDCSQEEIEKALTHLRNDETFFCKTVLSKILEFNNSDGIDECVAIQLTQRESEIAKYIAEGNTNKQIAEILCISPHTVHSHRKSLMKKLGVSSASDVTRYIFKQGLI